MARETVYLVQAFMLDNRQRLKPEKGVPCKSADAARRMAERMADTKTGVVALASTGDAELGDYDDEPVIIFRAGQLPEQYEN
ncbi:MAG TPA: hypothetical protein VLC29_02880 [Rhizomicrobium sp.]|jgi:hypothetical protein|nr:hypothetical protein [Rhizomicrobium sp.]